MTLLFFALQTYIETGENISLTMMKDSRLEYSLGDPGYSVADMFIMWRVGVHEFIAEADASAIRAFDIMHTGRRIKVEWGIGGLKSKFRRFQKPFDNTKMRFNHVFKTALILTKFLHRRRLNMEYTEI
jgi:DDE superfamily endonuclease